MRFALFQNFETEDTHGNKEVVNKKKVLVSILVILCAAIIAGVLYMFFKPEPLPQVSTAKVTKGSITQTLDMSARSRHRRRGTLSR